MGEGAVRSNMAGGPAVGLVSGLTFAFRDKVP